MLFRSDLGLIVAIASSLKNLPVEPDTLFLGEVGLTGEVRSISRAEERLREAAAMGFSRCYIPERNAAQIKEKIKGITLMPVRKVNDVIQGLFA